MSKEIIRCTYCGRFISQKDVENGNVKFEHTPDSAYSTEENIIICPSCVSKAADIDDCLFS